MEDKTARGVGRQAPPKKTPPYNHMGAHKLHKTNFRKSTMEELKTAFS